MGAIVRIHQPAQCTGACEQAMGCDCHPTAGRYPAPAAPDQPLRSGWGDLSEHHRPPRPKLSHPIKIIALAAATLAVISAIVAAINNSI